MLLMCKSCERTIPSDAAHCFFLERMDRAFSPAQAQLRSYVRADAGAFCRAECLTDYLLPWIEQQTIEEPPEDRLQRLLDEYLELKRAAESKTSF